MAEFRYIKRSALDKSRWDLIVRDDPNGSLFATTFFLDVMSDGWDAIIYGDYDALLPLPVRVRWGYRYVHTIPFCGPLAVYGPAASHININAMLGAIPPGIIRCDVNIWTDDPFPDGWAAQPRTNYMLDLSEGYSVIRSQFHSSCRNLLNRGLSEGLHIEHGFPIASQVSLAGTHGGLGRTSGRDIIRFQRLCEQWPDYGHIYSLAVTSPTGHAVAGAVFLRSHQQLHYLLGWSSREGRRENASRFLIDHIIRMHAGQPITLDFEGSDISGVAQFFSSFGAVPKQYLLLRRDNMPTAVKILMALRDGFRAGFTEKMRGPSAPWR